MGRTYNDLVLQGDGVGDQEALALDVHAERVRAHRKHIASGMSMEMQEYTHWRWSPVMMEELGEIARGLNDREEKMRVGVPEHMIMADLRKETIQLMAMCSAFIDALDMHDMSSNVRDDSIVLYGEEGFADGTPVVPT